MLEMVLVHYMLRFITMKHVIYEAILNAARMSGGALVWGAEPQRISNLMHFSMKI